MVKACAIAMLASTVMIAVPAAAQVIDNPLGVIVVPPTQTFTPGLIFTGGPENGANFEFALSQAMTLTASSFTNSSIGNTGVFDFTSIGLYSGVGTTGTLLQTGSMASFGNTHLAALDQIGLAQGIYTIAYRGIVTGGPAGVGSNITFAAAGLAGVPEPAVWGMMLLGFGTMGLAMRRRPTPRTSVSFA